MLSRVRSLLPTIALATMGTLGGFCIGDHIAEYLQPQPAPAAPSAVWQINDGDVSEGMWQELLAAGYQGDPTDGVEALYVPAGEAVQYCHTDSDCELAELAASR